MKTAAERQKAVRNRRIAEGMQRRLNMWVSAAAYEALSEQAKAAGLTRMQFLDALLLAGTASQPMTQSLPTDSAILANNESETPAGEEKPPPAKRSKKPSGKGIRNKKPRPQIQIDLFASVTPSQDEPTPQATQPSLWDEA